MVVMSILAILGTIGILTYRTSQIKARDMKRKNDFQSIAKALESYYNDYGQYPLSDVDGNILGCADVGGVCLWGEAFGGAEGEDSQVTTYLPTLPKDPVPTWRYRYEYLEGVGYRLYARLENTEDTSRSATGYDMICDPASVGGAQYCNYVVVSPIAPEPTARP
jgi:type II secretory pathway pseudopilin PulG